MEDISNVFIDPNTPTVDYAELDFEQQIAYTQNVKNRILHKLITTSPDGMPTDKDSVELLLKVTDSMDKSSIAKKRVSVDEKVSDHASTILHAIVQSIQTSGGVNPFVRDPSTPVLENRDLGELPDFTGQHASGEAEIGVIIENSDSFAKRMDEVNREEMERRAAEMGLTDSDVASQ